jgi:periplasmic protein TonB
MTTTMDQLAGWNRSNDGFRRMVWISFAIHITVLAVYIFFPRNLFAKPAPIVMTISLGGGIGERTTGATPISNKQVEKVEPPPKRPEPIKPNPAEKPNVMKVPEKPAPTPTKAIEKPAPPVPERPPSTGSEIRKGTSAAETGSAGVNQGLTVGGGSGAQAMLPANFCCMEWAQGAVALIEKNWNKTPPGGVKGDVIIKFTIHRDGSITDIELERASGSKLLDTNSLSAVRLAMIKEKFPPIPPAYTNESLTIHLTFPYKTP